ncbi:MULTISPECIES: hypothetical protein [Amycolatopsis]|uniref:hypothetical protein n=1 Tax=Amycolatopsis TaxID=1813 RepID=UPI0007DEEAFB|nr:MULTISPECIES: hypothetical protein [Amycolatopsis]OAP26054.1 hypothetical protein A4R44_03431 [Amycolatopsis sp. M39]
MLFWPPAASANRTAGDQENLRGRLGYADAYLNPARENGGLFYPREDWSFDENGTMILTDRLTGNARLNVPDGLWKMYHHPWTAEHFREPGVTAIEGTAEVLRAWYDREKPLLALTLRRVAGKPADVTLRIGNVDRPWKLFRDDVLAAESAGTGSPGPRTRAEGTGLVVSLPLTVRTNLTLCS